MLFAALSLSLFFFGVSCSACSCFTISSFSLFCWAEDLKAWDWWRLRCTGQTDLSIEFRKNTDMAYQTCFVNPKAAGAGIGARVHDRFTSTVKNRESKRIGLLYVSVEVGGFFLYLCKPYCIAAYQIRIRVIWQWYDSDMSDASHEIWVSGPSRPRGLWRSSCIRFSSQGAEKENSFKSAWVEGLTVLTSRLGRASVSSPSRCCHGALLRLGPADHGAHIRWLCWFHWSHPPGLKICCSCRFGRLGRLELLELLTQKIWTTI